MMILLLKLYFLKDYLTKKIYYTRPPRVVVPFPTIYNDKNLSLKLLFLLFLS